MIYGETNIKIEELKTWVNNLSLTDDKLEKLKPYSSIGSDFINKQITSLKNLVSILNDGDDWRTILMPVLNNIMFNLFFKIDNKAINVANYYECFLLPCDISTKKKIISGYSSDYKEIGEIKINTNGKNIGCIGEKSDLIWSVFYNDFIGHTENGQIDRYNDHDDYFTLQLWDIGKLNTEEFYNYVDEILLDCSINFELNFKIVNIPKGIQDKGVQGNYELKFEYSNYESIPLIYFNNGFQSDDLRLSFLSYYQVMEFFFIRVQNNKLLNDINPLITNNLTSEMDQLNVILRKYKNSTKEIESLKLALKDSISVSKLKQFINKASFYTTPFEDYNIHFDLSKSDEKIISKLANRIYFFRCAIAHAKGDSDHYIVLPNFNYSKIEYEVKLIKYIAYNVLTKYKSSSNT